MKLENKAALVTGASRGLGQALAEALAAKGARVVLVARTEADVRRAAAAIREKGGVAHALAFDVGDKEATHRIAAAAADLVGDVDVLVHNASTLGPVPLRLMLDTACEDLEDVLLQNVVGPFRLSRAIAGSMALRGQGTVAHVTSDAAVEAYPRWGAYSISKAALDAMSRAFAAEVPGVRFLSIDPGEMDTKMHADAVPDADRSALARPADVAAKVIEMLQDEVRAPSGARLTAPSWRRS